MRRIFQAVVLSLALFTLLTACAARGAEAPSPSPTVAADTAGTPAPETPAGAEPSPNAGVLKLVGEPAVVTVGSTKIHGAAYYAGEGDDTMVLPLVEVAKAMGWSVDEGVASAGPAEIKLTRDGADEVVVTFVRPDAEMRGHVDGVAVRKGEKQADVSRQPTPYIDGALYVTEAFIDTTLQEVDVKYDGAARITVEAKA